MLTTLSDSLSLSLHAGGAPELCDQFRFVASSAREMGRQVIDRCNLTALMEPGRTAVSSDGDSREQDAFKSLKTYGTVQHSTSENEKSLFLISDDNSIKVSTGD